MDARVFPGLFPRRVHSLRDPERRDDVRVRDATQIRSRPSTRGIDALTRARVRRGAPPASTLRDNTPSSSSSTASLSFLGGRVRRSFSAEWDSGHVISHCLILADCTRAFATKCRMRSRRRLTRDENSGDVGNERTLVLSTVESGADFVPALLRRVGGRRRAVHRQRKLPDSAVVTTPGWASRKRYP